MERDLGLSLPSWYFSMKSRNICAKDIRQVCSRPHGPDSRVTEAPSLEMTGQCPQLLCPPLSAELDL